MGLTTTVIPARAGSVRVPHKNVRLVAGKPLVAHAIEAGIGRIIVDTDDSQVRSIAHAYGAEVADRPLDLAGPDASIDDLLVERYLPWDGTLILLQPTVLHPYLPRMVEEFLNDFHQSSDPSWAMGTPERHLIWIDQNLPPDNRVNSQYLEPFFREVGCRVYRAGIENPAPARIWPVTRIFDIDTHADLAAARRVMEQGQIFFVVAADRVVGSGHLYRCLALAAELDHHVIAFTFDKPRHAPRWAHNLVKPWKVLEGLPENLKGATIVRDALDSSEQEMAHYKALGAKVVSFEDLGPGAKYADLLINDLYPRGDHPAERNGPDWAVMRPEYAISGRPYMPRNRILVSFGGVDPAGITERACREIQHLSTKLNIRVIEPPGRKLEERLPGINYITEPAMAAEMDQADLVLTSGGRTVWEAAAMGRPVVTILQNPREQTHEHLKMTHGIVNLGPAQLLESGAIMNTLEKLMLGDNQDFLISMAMGIKGLVDGHGTARIVREIEGLMYGT